MPDPPILLTDEIVLPPAIVLAGLEALRPSLEDLFVELTGEGFDVNG